MEINKDVAEMYIFILWGTGEAVGGLQRLLVSWRALAEMPALRGPVIFAQSTWDSLVLEKEQWVARTTSLSW